MPFVIVMPLSRFSAGKLGVVAPGCMSEATEMECGRSEIEELIKEVREGAGGSPEEWRPSQRAARAAGARLAQPQPHRDGL